MGGSSTSTKHETSSNTINPLQMQQYQDNYNTAKGTADSLQPFTGPLTAGFNQNQTNAQGILSGIATDPRYGQINQDAMSQIKGVMGSIPNGQINAQTYDPAQLAGTDLSPYMNPFQSQVIDASIAQNGYARDQQGVKDNAAATAAHAFGGTRQAVQAAETSGAYDRNNQQNIASLNAANFGQAREGALADIGSQNQARQYNASQNQNAQQNSFANALAAQGLRMDAAGRLVSIGQADLQRATQQGGILSAIGDAQQQQQQSEYGNEYNRYMQNQNIAMQRQQLLNQALGIIPLEQTNTSDGTTTTKQNPGALGILSAVGGLGMAAATGGASMGLTGGLGMLGGSIGGTMGSMTSLGSMAGAGGSPFSLGSISSALPKANYGGIFG